VQNGQDTLRARNNHNSASDGVINNNNNDLRRLFSSTAIIVTRSLQRPPYRYGSSADADYRRRFGVQPDARPGVEHRDVRPSGPSQMYGGMDYNAPSPLQGGYGPAGGHTVGLPPAAPPQWNGGAGGHQAILAEAQVLIQLIEQQLQNQLAQPDADRAGVIQQLNMLNTLKQQANQILVVVLFSWPGGGLLV